MIASQVRITRATDGALLQTCRNLRVAGEVIESVQPMMDGYQIKSRKSNKPIRALPFWQQMIVFV